MNVEKDKKIFDNLILAAYNLGWDECYFGDDSNKALFKKDSILECAYLHGWSDYIAGDDVSSIDAQTNEEILQLIKRIYESK